MSRDDAHPALHTPPLEPHNVHYVPEGWEDFDRGVCPCGEVVVWNESGNIWLVARDYRVLVMSPDEVALLRRSLIPSGVRAQLALQDEIESYEEAAG